MIPFLCFLLHYNAYTPKNQDCARCTALKVFCRTRITSAQHPHSTCIYAYNRVCYNEYKEKQNTDSILSEGESVRTKVRDNIELDLLCHNQPESAPVMQEIYELVVETIQLRSPVLRLGNNLFSDGLGEGTPVAADKRAYPLCP